MPYRHAVLRFYFKTIEKVTVLQGVVAMKIFTKKSGVVISLLTIAALGVLLPSCSAPKQETSESMSTDETPQPVVETVKPAPVPQATTEVAAITEREVNGKKKRITHGTPEEPKALDPLTFEPKLRPYADSPYAKQIDTALMWMAANQNQRTCNWMDYGILDYLQRKFALDDGFAGEALVDLNKMEPEKLAEINLHGRVGRAGHNFADAKILLEQVSLFARYTPEGDQKYITAVALEYLGTSISGVVLRAMYCDQVKVDDAFIDELVRQAMETEFKGKPNSFGGYFVCHMIWAYQWLNELGCAEAFTQLADVEDGFADQLVAIAEDQELKNDLAVEAMAVLYYLGYADRIPQKWLDTVAAAQLEDGSWDRKGGDGRRPMPQGHTTVLALWVLLENAVPDAEDIPWLR